MNAPGACKTASNWQSWATFSIDCGRGPLREVVSFGDSLDDDADPHRDFVDFIEREHSIVHQLDHKRGSACAWGRGGSGDVLQTRHDCGVDPVDLHNGRRGARKMNEKPRETIGSPWGVLAVEKQVARINHRRHKDRPCLASRDQNDKAPQYNPRCEACVAGMAEEAVA